MELAQEWIENGFRVSRLLNGSAPYYQLFHEDMFGLRLVGGSYFPEDMNSLAASAWKRMAVAKAQEDDIGYAD